MCEEVVKCYKDILNSKGKDKWIEAIKNLQKMTKKCKIIHRSNYVESLRNKWVLLQKKIAKI